jgi:ATP phosphoribosyltransferase regulatory subunit
MSTESWLLPDGVDELLPPEARRMESLRRLVLDLFSTWGYELVMPPFMDYVGSLLTGTGEDLDLQTFKVIDQYTGRLMGVRADMTPQVARIDARRLQHDGPARLCYVGTVLRTVTEELGGTRIPIQVGAELYGHRGMESDCEVLCLMLETLRVAGIAEPHLDLGHVGIFRQLAQQGRLDGRAEARLHDALQRKAVDELASEVKALAVDARVGAMIVELADLNGGGEVLGRARASLRDADPAVHSCIDQLDALARAVAVRQPGVPIHFDLAELRGYHYHTGVVFGALVPGFGREVARGGRYDEIGNVFGRARAATGFSTDLKQLMALGAIPDAQDYGLIEAPWSDDPVLLERIQFLRASGRRVAFALPHREADGVAPGVGARLERVNGQWQAVPVDEAAANAATANSGSTDGV